MDLSLLYYLFFLFVHFFNTINKTCLCIDILFYSMEHIVKKNLLVIINIQLNLKKKFEVNRENDY